MAWEERPNGRRYFYSAKRVGGKVVKKCHGRGLAAILAESHCKQLAERRKRETLLRNEVVAELWRLEAVARMAKQAARQALYATYILAGYWRTNCYHWKRSRDNMEIPTLASLKEQDGPANNLEGDVCDPRSNEDISGGENRFWPKSIEETIRLIMAGRKDLLSQLRLQISEVPDLWREVSDTTKLAVEGWAQKIAQGKIEMQECIVLASMEQRKELLSESSSIMERVMVDRFVICKIQLAYFGVYASFADDTMASSKVESAMEKRHRSAEYQFREAARQLAKVKELQGEGLLTQPANAAIKLFNPESNNSEVA